MEKKRVSSETVLTRNPSLFRVGRLRYVLPWTLSLDSDLRGTSDLKRKGSFHYHFPCVFHCGGSSNRMCTNVCEGSRSMLCSNSTIFIDDDPQLLV